VVAEAGGMGRALDVATVLADTATVLADAVTINRILEAIVTNFFSAPII
jgi:hypothetical protein